MVKTSPVKILTIRFEDGNGYTWIWDLPNEWLDIVYPEGEEREPGSGYPAETWDEVLKIMKEGGFI
jgi:hypothetical protein